MPNDCYLRYSSMDIQFDVNESGSSQSREDLAKKSSKDLTIQKSRPRRRKYKKVSEEDRFSLLNCYERGGNWRKLGKSLGINYSTLRSIIHRCNAEVRGRYVRRKVDNQMLARLESFLCENDTISISEMTNRLSIEMPEKDRVHRVTVGRSLDGMLYTTKGIIPFQRTDLQSFDIFQRRKEYAKWFTNATDCDLSNICFVDKINFNIWCLNINRRGHPESTKSDADSILDRTIVTVQLIVAINGKLGLLHSDINDGVDPAQQLNQFFDKLSDNVLENNSNQEVIIVMDGAFMPHCDVAGYLQEGVTIKFLRPGCSDFNPVQPCLSKLKQDIKLDLSLRQIQFLTKPSYSANIAQHRRNMLISLLKKHLNAITADAYLYYYRQMYDTILATLKDESLSSDV